MIQYPDYQWVDTAFGGTHRRNQVLSLTEMGDGLPEDRIDCYATWHRFPDAYRAHCQATGSTGGYSGSSYVDFLPFDFDGEDLDVVLNRVRDFLKMLEVTYEIDGLHGIRCYFSGRKGFHILLSATLFGGWAPSPQLPRHLKEVARTVAQDFEADLSIYDQNRLLRLPHTKHSKSGLWKIPLEAHAVLSHSADTIRQMAAEGSREVVFPAWDDCEVAVPCAERFKGITSTQRKEPSPIKKQTADLFPVGMKKGDGRDNQAFLIARYLRDKRLSKDIVLRILQLWDGNQVDLLGEKVLEQKIQSAYSRTVGEIDDEIASDDIKTPTELVAEYTAYIDKLKTSKIKLGWPEVDARLRGIAPGEVLTIIAKSGVGKTAVLQNILRHIAQSQDAVCLFCSLEQPLAQVFERFAQLGTSEAGEDIEKSWQDATEQERIALAVKDDLGDQVLTCGRSLKFHQLSQVLDATEAKMGHPVNVLAVDYLGLLDTSDLDKTLYGQISRAARELKTLAKQRDISVICLCQVSRANGEDGSKPLNIYSARESGAIEESADFLLGLYRPDLDGEDKTIHVQILKNRKGQHGVEFPYHFDKTSLRITAPQLALIDGQAITQHKY